MKIKKNANLLLSAQRKLGSVLQFVYEGYLIFIWISCFSSSFSLLPLADDISGPASWNINEDN